MSQQATCPRLPLSPQSHAPLLLIHCPSTCPPCVRTLSSQATLVAVAVLRVVLDKGGLSAPPQLTPACRGQHRHHACHCRPRQPPPLPRPRWRASGAVTRAVSGTGSRRPSPLPPRPPRPSRRPPAPPLAAVFAALRRRPTRARHPPPALTTPVQFRPKSHPSRPPRRPCPEQVSRCHTLSAV